MSIMTESFHLIPLLKVKFHLILEGYTVYSKFSKINLLQDVVYEKLYSGVQINALTMQYIIACVISRVPIII